MDAQLEHELVVVRIVSMYLVIVLRSGTYLPDDLFTSIASIHLEVHSSWASRGCAPGLEAERGSKLPQGTLACWVARAKQLHRRLSWLGILDIKIQDTEGNHKDI
ncbi:hypothetical protein B0H14DRAFT_2571053 [Mycena olivaceomarginata]|nr:hypothetical protein B0H14DRAFT_2571053 [Mycena olivaceomarginata]